MVRGAGVAAAAHLCHEGSVRQQQKARSDGFMSDQHAQFAIGQVVHHKKFGYRGVIVDVDPTFQGSEEWYEVMAKSRPPKDKPWYQVLVHDGTHRTYVAERHLEPDPTGQQINHPELGVFFDTFEGGRYTRRRRGQ